MQIISRKTGADFLGIFSSLLCLIHCAGIPILVLVSSMNIQLLTGDWHWLHYGFIGLSLLAVYWSSKKATSRIRYLLWMFFSIFSGALLLHEMMPQAIYISVAASVGLVIVHGVNSWKKLYTKSSNYGSI